MPSSPQTVTTRGVFDYLLDTKGSPLVGKTVNCTLNFNGSSVTSPIVNLGELQQSTVTDQNGFWRFLLVPNDTITPTGTLYSINAGNIASYDISVPSGGADVQSSSILANTPSVLSPALTNLTGPITVTGNETVTGNLTVSGTTTLGSTTTGALTTAAETVGGDLTIASAFRLLFGAAAAKIIPGATSISHRNNADSADNLLITDAGAVTVRSTLAAAVTTLTADNALSGILILNNPSGAISGHNTGTDLRANAVQKWFVGMDDSGNFMVFDNVGSRRAVTVSNTTEVVTTTGPLSVPPSLAGTVAATSYGTVPVKIVEQVISSATASFTLNFPAGFRNLRLYCARMVTDQGSAQDVRLRFNGDSSANHYHWAEYFWNTSLAANSVNTASSITDGSIIIGKAVISGGHGGSSETTIFNYNDTANNITLRNKQFFDDGTNIWVVDLGGAWYPSSLQAATSLTILPAAGNITAGVFTLWGDP